jgi:hypothetical protein
MRRRRGGATIVIMESQGPVAHAHSAAGLQRPGTDDPRADIGRLLISCPDRPGIVAGVSRCLYEHGANIVESQQYSTNPQGGTFFLRADVKMVISSHETTGDLVRGSRPSDIRSSTSTAGSCLPSPVLTRTRRPPTAA